MGKEPRACGAAAPGAGQGAQCSRGATSGTHPPLVTEELQQPGNLFALCLGQETDAAWWRKHLKKISTPCASLAETRWEQGVRGAETPWSGPGWGRCSSAAFDGIVLGRISWDGKSQRDFSLWICLCSLRSAGAGAHHACSRLAPLTEGPPAVPPWGMRWGGKEQICALLPAVGLHGTEHSFCFWARNSTELFSVITEQAAALPISPLHKASHSSPACTSNSCTAPQSLSLLLYPARCPIPSQPLL